MDEYIKQSIEARKNAIETSCKLDAEGKRKGLKAANTGATVVKSVAGGIVSGVADRALNEVKNSVLPTRAAVHQKMSDAARSVPVLGDAIDAGQKASYLGHLGKLFGKKK